MSFFSDKDIIFYSDEELLEIVSKRKNELTSDEIASLINALKRRKVKMRDIAFDESTIHKLGSEEKENKTAQKMDWALKTLTFFLPIILNPLAVFLLKLCSIPYADLLSLPICIGFFIVVFYYIKKEGYLIMAKQFRKWIFICYIVCVILLLLEDVLVHIHNVS